MKAFGKLLCGVVMMSLLFPAAIALAADEVWIELWDENVRTTMVKKGSADHPQVNWFLKEFGIGYYQSELLGWNSGKDYYQKLNLRIAAGKLPDLFLPWQGIEYEMAKQGALAELSELLPEHAPNVWKMVPENVWNAVRANSPDGQSIYFIPKVYAAAYCNGFIRQDWLDRVGMEMPTTIEEYEAVLRAFKVQDANGNDDPNDEIPTSGRENARWMDHLFAPFSVAMYEGFPDWDIYDGKLQYAGVQPEMKAALAWIRKLYQEGLLDQETFLNTSKAWTAKNSNDQVGSYYHGPQWQAKRIRGMLKVNADANLVILPTLKAEGYEGFYTDKPFNRPQWAIAAGDEEKIIASLKLLDILTDPAYLEHHTKGYEGFNYKVEDGQESRITIPKDKYEGMYSTKVITDMERKMVLVRNIPEDNIREQVMKLVEGTETTARRVIAGQGIPVSIYEDYPDIKAHQLYFEYAAKIIVGDWPLDKFDELVEKWNKSGGADVTKRAQDWYANVVQ